MNSNSSYVLPSYSFLGGNGRVSGGCPDGYTCYSSPLLDQNVCCGASTELQSEIIRPFGYLLADVIRIQLFINGFFLIFFLDSLISFLIHSFIDSTAVCVCIYVCMTSTKNKESDHAKMKEYIFECFQLSARPRRPHSSQPCRCSRCSAPRMWTALVPATSSAGSPPQPHPSTHSTAADRLTALILDVGYELQKRANIAYIIILKKYT